MGLGMLLTKVKLEKHLHASTGIVRRGENTDFFRHRGTSPPPPWQKIVLPKRIGGIRGYPPPFKESLPL